VIEIKYTPHIGRAIPRLHAIYPTAQSTGSMMKVGKRAKERPLVFCSLSIQIFIRNFNLEGFLVFC
jgi:hypothetical protein